MYCELILLQFLFSPLNYFHSQEHNFSFNHSYFWDTKTVSNRNYVFIYVIYLFNSY